MSSSKSYLKVQYDLRPSKQVERRMLIDAFHSLALVGFPLYDYQYTGFGSIHFVDFVLFHKFLGIKKMLSIEHDQDIEKRVRFNKPYKSIDIKIASAAEIIPGLSKYRKHILWLDYDQIVNKDMLDEVALAVSFLSPGSIILITIDVEPPGLETDEDYGPKRWRSFFVNVAEQYLGNYSNESDFVEGNLRKINVEILHNVIRSTLSAKAGVTFYPLFNFSYADGHEMLTLGGMIASDTDRTLINKSNLKDKSYVKFDLSKKPFEIRVPKVTRKERLYLDSNMPCNKNWKPRQFEFSKNDIKAYREIYRYFPAYAEMML